MSRAVARTFPLAFLSAFLWFSQPALAVDGVIEINQAAVAAGGITPSDDPGFPATLDRRGSYRLTSSLSAPAGSHGIHITAEDVTLDLNGFTIAGPAIIICLPVGCAPNDGIGVLGTTRNRVHGGFVRKMGGGGVRLSAYSAVERVTASENGSHGILVGGSSRVHACIATDNARAGIKTSFDSVVTDNVSTDNDEEGIRAEANSTVRGNTAASNGEAGIFAPSGTIEGNKSLGNGGIGIHAINNATVVGNSVNSNDGVGISMTNSGYAHNVAASNGNLFSSSDEIVGGVSMGGNVCDGAPCP